jgi:hypothetical protein
MEEPINLDHFEREFFRRAIRRSVQEYVAHFGERLVAIYVVGSVHRNEAVPGVSDLDIYAVIADAFSETDEEWRQQEDPGGLEREFGSGCGVGSAMSMASLFGPPPPAGVKWYDVPEGFAFPPDMVSTLLMYRRYDATLVWGRDITAGLAIPPPDRRWAKEEFLGLWDLIRDFAGLPNEGRFDPDPLLKQPSLQLRKLARHAVYGGVLLLIGLGEFRSFRGADVIPALERRFPEWTGWLEETRGLYIEPQETTPEEVAAYLSRLLTWLEWIKPPARDPEAGDAAQGEERVHPDLCPTPLRARSAVLLRATAPAAVALGCRSLKR